MKLDRRDGQIIAEALLRNFTKEQLAHTDLLERQPTGEVRRELADMDFLFFCQFYLRHHFELPPAPIHRALAERIQDIMAESGPTFDAIGWPRGHAKTTFVSLGLPLYSITPALPRVRYIPIIADSQLQARAYLTVIKDELEHNERILEDYGDLRGTTWQSTQITTSNRACVDALGRGMKIRGRKFLRWRPGMLILDDIEEIERTQSPTNREADANWLARSVMKAGAPDCKFLILGTIIHYDSVLSRVLKDPMFRSRLYKAVLKWSPEDELWDEWGSILTDLSNDERKRDALAFYKEYEEQMIAGTEVAWPERYSYYDLMLMKVTGQGLTEGSSFEAEMQNEPVDPKLRFFKHIGKYHAEWRVGIPGEGGDTWLIPASGRPAVALGDCLLFMGCDPSLGKKTVRARTDPSATIVLAKSPYGIMFVLENIIDWLTPDQIINNMVEYGKRYAFTDVPVEAVQFQYLFATDAARASALEGVYLPVSPVSATSNKDLRIKSLQPDLHNEYILFPEQGAETLIKQLEDYPMGAHDDGPDCLELVRRVAKEYKSGSHATAVQAPSHTFGQEHLPGQRDPYEAYEKVASPEELGAFAKSLADRHAKEKAEADAPPGAYPWYPKTQ